MGGDARLSERTQVSDIHKVTIRRFRQVLPVRLAFGLISPDYTREPPIAKDNAGFA